MNEHGTCRELVGATKGLAEEHPSLGDLHALGIKTLQQGEVELALEETCAVLPLTEQCFKLLLLSDESDGIDTFVHAERVFPVVGRLRIFGVVLDTYSLTGIHVALHDFLLDTAHLSTDGILGVTFLNTIARQIA